MITAREYTMLKLEDRVDPEGTRSVMETAQKYDDRGFEKKPLATLNSPQKRKQRLIGELLPTQLSHKLCSMTALKLQNLRSRGHALLEHEEVVFFIFT